MGKTFKSIQQFANIVDSVVIPLSPGYRITKEVAKFIEEKLFEEANEEEKRINKLIEEKQLSLIHI